MHAYECPTAAGPARDYLRQKAGALRRHASAVADGLRTKIAESKVGQHGTGSCAGALLLAPLHSAVSVLPSPCIVDGYDVDGGNRPE